MIEADVVLVGPTGAVEPEGLDQIEVGAWGGGGSGGGGGGGGGGGDPHEAGRAGVGLCTPAGGPGGAPPEAIPTRRAASQPWRSSARSAWPWPATLTPS